MKRRPVTSVGWWLMLICVLFLAGMGAYQYVAYVPPALYINRLTLALNAREDFLAAVQLLPADSDRSFEGPRPAGLPATSASHLDTPTLVALVQSGQPALVRLRQGLKREFQAVPTYSGLPDPEFAGYRRFARFLTSANDLAVREGRSDDALRLGLETIQMGTMIPRDGRLIDSLVGNAIGSVGLSSIERALPAASPEALTQAAHELYALDRTAPTYLAALQTERHYGYAVLTEELRQQPPESALRSLGAIARASGELPNWSQFQYSFAMLTTPRREILGEYQRSLDAEIERARKPYQNRSSLPPRPENPVTAGVVPVSDELGLYYATRAVALRRIMVVRLAVRAYTLKEGKTPRNLATLVPRYLPTVPEDPYAATSLSYRVPNGEPLVYSQGPDGDDDGGKDLGSRLTPEGDGDLASMHRR